MKDWFKPLLIYKKYLLAEKILKHCCGSYGWVQNSPGEEENLLTKKQYPNVYLASNFLDARILTKTIDSNRLLEVVDLLESNKHITCKRHPNLYHFSITATEAGERALNDGFYKKQVYSFFFKLTGVTGIGGIVIWLMSRFL